MNAVRGALDPLDPAAFAKVLADARKPYSGTPADAWFRDASLLAAVKLRVLAFERQNAVQKASPQQRRQFAAEIESAEKQLATRAFSGDMTALIARARNPGAPQPAVARTAPPAAPPVAATNPPADTKVPATPAAPAVLPPAARAELPGSAAGLATWCGKLRERVIAGTKSGQKPTAYLALFGGKESAVTVVGADDKELLIEMGGGKLPVPWNKLDQRKDMLNLARAFAKEDAPADHLLKAVFLLVNGMNDEAEDAFLKALELKLPGGAEAVESARQSLKG
jgi:hypothetical protein